MKFRRIRTVFWFLGIILLGSYFYFFLPVWGIPFNAQRHGNPPLTPAWALECWLWEDDVNTADYVDELLEGYKKHDIPVRTILLDSPWSLRYNDFIMDTIRYPDPKNWFGNLGKDGYRVVLWMTSMVNDFNKDTRIKEDRDWYDNARKQGFLTKSGTPIDWWKGRGGFIDYSDPDAMAWWHGLQQDVFDLGIDGWKLDGTATLFRQQWGPIPFFYKMTAAGIMSTRNYMDHYYRDEYAYGLGQNPDFVTLSRSMDRGYHPEGFAPIDASPVNWVGDQKHEWVTGEMIKNSGEPEKDIALDGVQGFESAIKSILKSAELGYNIVGSDVAGFSGRTIPPRLYIRWAQFSSFCGLFLNGGHGERRLWKRSDRELEIIRKYAWLHTELVPYMYHYVVTAHNGGRRLQKTLKKGKYQYMFGDDFLIAPIYRDDNEREISLPEGKWRYLFGDKELLQGPRTFEKDFPLDEFPIYIKEGAIVPLNVERDYTKFGDRDSKGFVTILIYPDNQNSFTYDHPTMSKKTEIRYKMEENTLKVVLDGTKIPHILRIHSTKPPKEICLDNKSLDPAFWSFEADLKKILIRTDIGYDKGEYIIKF